MKHIGNGVSPEMVTAKGILLNCKNICQTSELYFSQVFYLSAYFVFITFKHLKERRSWSLEVLEDSGWAFVPFANILPCRKAKDCAHRIPSLFRPPFLFSCPVIFHGHIVTFPMKPFYLFMIWSLVITIHFFIPHDKMYHISSSHSIYFPFYLLLTLIPSF